jgi:CheY-like chemotaxis protein
MRSILIVARTALWRDVLAARLEHEGYTVNTANDSTQALAALSNGSLPGAILLDTTLPKKQWQKVKTRLDSEPRLQSIRRLFVVSALSPMSAPQSGPVFESPVDPEHVARALRALYPDLERHRLPPGRVRAPTYLNDVIDEGIEAALAN